MVELRQAAAELIAEPLVPIPPLEGVVARARAYQAARRRRQVGAGLALVVLTVVAVARATTGGIGLDSLRTVGRPGGGDDDDVPAATTSTIPALGGGSTSFPSLPWSGHTFDGDWSRLARRHPCETIRRATPALKVLVSPGSPYFDAVDRLFEHVNVEGGVCGRSIELVRGATGGNPGGDYVAILGLPFDGGLEAATTERRAGRAALPVVTGDGLTEAQHRAPGVYPVGPSAAVMTRTATQHAIDHGAKSFAIVYDDTMAFGREAAATFDQYVRSRHGTLKATVPWHPSADAYSPSTDRLSTACGIDGCDFVLLAVLSEHAKQWMATNPLKPRVQLAGLSPMLSDELNDHCIATRDQRCDGLMAWSGYEPWTPARWWNVEAEYAYGRAGTGQSAMREGAIVAARVLWEALQLAGPDATAGDVRRALDAMTFRSQVTAPLSWPGVPRSQAWVLRTDGMVPQAERPEPTAPAEWDSWAARDGNRYAEALRVEARKPYWHPAGTGWVGDPGAR